MRYRTPFNIRERSLGFANYVAQGLFTYRDRLIIQASFLVAAIILGVAAVYFTQFIHLSQAYYVQLFSQYPHQMAAVTPFAFWASVAVIKYFAPYAGGSGVPQVLHAAALNNEENRTLVSSGLLSIKTAVVKVISTGFGLIGGASIGGEGPTVQIGGAIFATIGDTARKYYPNIDFRSYIVAAGGAGFAAAFNTPLGGVSFALEEIALNSFGELRQAVMLAVIVAGLTARAIVGDELYFGRMLLPSSGLSLLPWAAFIGVVCGFLGGGFGKIVSSRRLYKLKINWWQRALICGLIVAAIDLCLNGAVAGPNVHLTRFFEEGSREMQPWYFPLAKLLATATSTLSGMGGGILAPSISIGGWTGISLAKLVSFSDPRIFALLGMAAYFAAAFQIPVTSVIVVMEMTNQHDFIIPMMVAALIAHSVSRLLMPTSLYHVLIERSFHKKTLSD